MTNDLQKEAISKRKQAEQDGFERGWTKAALHAENLHKVTLNKTFRLWWKGLLISATIFLISLLLKHGLKIDTELEELVIPILAALIFWPLPLALYDSMREKVPHTAVSDDEFNQTLRKTITLKNEDR